MISCSISTKDKLKERINFFMNLTQSKSKYISTIYQSIKYIGIDNNKREYMNHNYLL